MMREELKGKGVELTLKHPKVDGGVQTYRTEDGWEMIVMLGKKEGESYQMHRMMMTGPALVEELITSLIKECPEMAMPIVGRALLGQLKEHVGQVLAGDEPNDKSSMSNNEPPPGTKFN